MILSQVLASLAWWRVPGNVHSGLPTYLPDPLVLTVCWGTHLGSSTVWGTWSLKERKHIISFLVPSSWISGDHRAIYRAIMSWSSQTMQPQLHTYTNKEHSSTCRSNGGNEMGRNDPSFPKGDIHKKGADSESRLAQKMHS